MAARDDDAPPPTFPELFVIYSNFDLKKGVVLEGTVKYEKILLSQADFWMQKANLIGKDLTLTETGIAFNKYKKWRLNFEEFHEYLENICKAKHLDINEVTELLTQVGPPTASDMVKIT